MAPVSEFDAMVQAFGTTTVGYIGREYLSSVSVVASMDSCEASVVIVPQQHDAETYDRIIDKMIEVRGMYLGELHIDYIIAESDETEAVRTPRNAVFATA